MSPHVNYTPEEFLSVALSNESINAERRGAVKALREAAEAWGDGTEGFPYSWLHDRADQIEEGK